MDKIKPFLIFPGGRGFRIYLAVYLGVMLVLCALSSLGVVHGQGPTPTATFDDWGECWPEFENCATATSVFATAYPPTVEPGEEPCFGYDFKGVTAGHFNEPFPWVFGEGVSYGANDTAYFDLNQDNDFHAEISLSAFNVEQDVLASFIFPDGWCSEVAGDDYICAESEGVEIPAFFTGNDTPQFVYSFLPGLGVAHRVQVFYWTTADTLVFDVQTLEVGYPGYGTGFFQQSVDLWPDRYIHHITIEARPGFGSVGGDTPSRFEVDDVILDVPCGIYSFIDDVDIIPTPQPTPDGGVWCDDEYVGSFYLETEQEYSPYAGRGFNDPEYALGAPDGLSASYSDEPNRSYHTFSYGASITGTVAFFPEGASSSCDSASYWYSELPESGWTQLSSWAWNPVTTTVNSLVYLHFQGDCYAGQTGLLDSVRVDVYNGCYQPITAPPPGTTATPTTEPTPGTGTPQSTPTNEITSTFTPDPVVTIPAATGTSTPYFDGGGTITPIAGEPVSVATADLGPTSTGEPGPSVEFGTPFPYSPVGGESDVPLSVFRPELIGLGCWRIGPYEIDGEMWGVEICLKQYRFNVGLLGYNFVTDILPVILLAGVVILYIRTR